MLTTVTLFDQIGFQYFITRIGNLFVQYRFIKSVREVIHTVRIIQFNRHTFSLRIRWTSFRNLLQNLTAGVDDLYSLISLLLIDSTLINLVINFLTEYFRIRTHLVNTTFSKRTSSHILNSRHWRNKRTIRHCCKESIGRIGNSRIRVKIFTTKHAGRYSLCNIHHCFFCTFLHFGFCKFFGKRFHFILQDRLQPVHCCFTCNFFCGHTCSEFCYLWRNAFLESIQNFRIVKNTFAQTFYTSHCKRIQSAVERFVFPWHH